MEDSAQDNKFNFELSAAKTNGELNIPVLSKRQLKKLKKQAQWEEKKKEKRLKEREKCKLKRLAAMVKGLPTRTGPSRKELKKNKFDKSPSILKIAIDLDYDDLMIDKDIAKSVKQLLRIYTINRRSDMPATLHFTGIKENGRIHTVLKKNDGYENWDVHWVFHSYVNHFENDQIVYLTSDSEDVLDCIDPNKVYVIGGLVDHNHHKGLCYERAQKLSLKTARLPLNEHVEMKTRTVLSTYHVFEILLRLSEGKLWSEAILESLPMRKGAKAKISPEDAEDVMIAPQGQLGVENIGSSLEETHSNITEFELKSEL